MGVATTPNSYPVDLCRLTSGFGAQVGWIQYEISINVKADVGAVYREMLAAIDIETIDYAFPWGRGEGRVVEYDIVVPVVMPVVSGFAESGWPFRHWWLLPGLMP